MVSPPISSNRSAPPRLPRIARYLPGFAAPSVGGVADIKRPTRRARLDDRVTALDIAAALPTIEILRGRSLAVSMLDAILWPEWEGRRYWYTADWGGGQSATEIRDGCGNDCFVVYTSAGAFIKGFDHESEMSPGRTRPPKLWPGLIDDVPEVFAEFLTEPAFLDPSGCFAATFCIWRQHGDNRWLTGPVDYATVRDRNDPDGAHDLLGLFTDSTSQSYRTFAASYFGVQTDPVAVSHVFDLRPLTQEVVARLNPDLTLDDLDADIRLAGYPTEGGVRKSGL